MERFRINFREHSHTIGVAELGVVSMSMSAVVRIDSDAGRERECRMQLGGLESATDTFVEWAAYDLEVGDKIIIEVLPDGSFDVPTEIRTPLPDAADLKRESVRRMAAELGWTLIENDASSGT